MITTSILTVFAVLLSDAQTPPQASPQPKPYDPVIAPASDEAALALKGIRAPEGLKVELFAAEPLLANPVAFWIDERGRMYVVETFRLHAGVTDNRQHMDWLDDDLACRTVEDRVAMYRKHLPDQGASYTVEHDRIRLVVDSDGDGKADRSTVFADGFNTLDDGLASGVISRKGEVWFTCIPSLWRLRDLDGDGVADEKSALQSGFGVHVAFLGHDLHGLRFGPDGRLYFSIGDRGFNVKTEGKSLAMPDTGAVFRCEPDGSGLEVFATGLRNPQELAFNELGDLFTGENNSDSGDRARWVHLVEGSDSGWRMSYQYIESPVSRGPWNAEKLWLPRWEGQAAYIIPPIANLGDGPSGLVFYPGVGLPSRYDRHFFLCDFRGVSGMSGIRSFSLERKGASYDLVDQHQFLWSLLVTDCDFGPDCALYATDWVTGWEKPGKGRIYKVSHPLLASSEKAQETRNLLGSDFGALSTVELTRLLDHADMRVRQEAQFTLAERGVAAVPALFGVTRADGGLAGKLHAVWGLGQIARRDRQVLPSLTALLDHADTEVRAQAAKVVGDLRAEGAHDRLASLLKDPDSRVQFFAAMGLGKIAQAGDVAALCDLLRSNADRDLYVRHAAVMGLAGLRDPNALFSATADPSSAVRMGALLALRRLESPEIARFLGDADERLVTEAARAIHDVPIAPALPQLAAMPIGPRTPEPLALRILLAAFRLGGKTEVERVGTFAADRALPARIRIESLECLAVWPKPPGRDRLLGLWRPVSPRPEGLAHARAALGPRLGAVLGDGSEEIRLAALDSAIALELNEAAASFRKIVEDPRDSAVVRARALRGLAALHDTGLLKTALSAAVDAAPEVRIEGQRIVSSLKPEEAVPMLQAALEKGVTTEQQGAFASLGESKSSAARSVLAAWLEKLLAGQVAPAVQLDLLEAAEKQATPELRALAERHEASKPAESPLAKYRECLTGGDAKRGQQVFFQKREVSCQRCHKTNKAGGEVGPDLADLGLRAQRDHILESIVAPNAKITEGYSSVTLATKDGRVLSGVLRKEDEKAVQMISPDGVVLTIDKDEIAERSGGLSAMPEDLTKFLSRREVRDLVEYLAGLKFDKTMER